MLLASSIQDSGYSTVIIQLEEFPHQEVRAIQPYARYQETESGFLCLECPGHTLIKRKQDMIRHLEKTAKHGERRYPCPKCERLYTRPETLRDHKCKAKKL